MFDKIKDWILRGIDKMFNKATIEEALKVKTAVSETMDKAMQLWLSIYTNNAPWLDKETESLQLGASIAEEFARLTTLELKSEITGSKRAEYLKEQCNKVLDNIQEKLGLFNAVGGGFLKPYFYNNNIYIDFIPQTDCKPLKFDSAGNITSIVFISQVHKSNKIYTRLETHTLSKSNYIVENKSYITEEYNPGIIGRSIPLSNIEEWSNLEERIVITDVEKPLFAYYKTPVSNNIDTKSCLGISVYSKAIDSIKRADKQYGRLDYEYDSAERSIYASIDALKGDNATAKRSRIIKTLDTNEGNFYKEFSPPIRDEAFIRGLNKTKQEIEFQCALAYGTLSDPNQDVKTATEMKMSKQRSYSTVVQMQKNLEKTLKHLISIIDVYCDLYELTPSGKYDVSFEWDDSIIVDAQTEQSIMMQEANLGYIRKELYLMKRYGVTEQQAKAMIPNAESNEYEVEE